jgi:hypothetical protein
VVISSGWVSHSRVEPSTSANSNVTVPVGKRPLTPSSLQSISLMLASMRSPRTAKHQHKRVLCSRTEAQFTTLLAEIYDLRRMVSTSHDAIVDSIAK